MLYLFVGAFDLVVLAFLLEVEYFVVFVNFVGAYTLDEGGLGGSEVALGLWLLLG